MPSLASKIYYFLNRCSRCLAVSAFLETDELQSEHLDTFNSSNFRRLYLKDWLFHWDLHHFLDLLAAWCMYSQEAMAEERGGLGLGRAAKMVLWVTESRNYWVQCSKSPQGQGIIERRASQSTYRGLHGGLEYADML